MSTGEGKIKVDTPETVPESTHSVIECFTTEELEAELTRRKNKNLNPDILHKNKRGVDPLFK